jgi:hypothetical protein
MALVLAATDVVNGTVLVLITLVVLPIAAIDVEAETKRQISNFIGLGE